MRGQIQRWGNSLALRIPKPFAEAAGVKEGTTVRLSVSGGRLVAVPVRRPKLRLKDLLVRVNPRNLHGEIRTGATVGREIW